MKTYHIKLIRCIIGLTLSLSYTTYGDVIDETLQEYQEKNRKDKELFEAKFQKIENNFIQKLNALKKSYSARGKEMKVIKIDELLEKLKQEKTKKKGKVAKEELDISAPPPPNGADDFGTPLPPGEKPKVVKKKSIPKKITKEELINSIKAYNLTYTGKCKLRFNKKGDIVHLDLGGAGITDITPLAKLTELRSLELWGNSIHDLTPLKRMPNLHWLGLNHNLITDISILKDIPLQGVSLASLPIQDLSPLNDKITHLDIENCSLITDMTPVSKMKKLERLILPKQFKKLNIKFIKNLTKLKHLDTRHWRKEGVWSKEKFLEKYNGDIE